MNKNEIESWSVQHEIFFAVEALRKTELTLIRIGELLNLRHEIGKHPDKLSSLSHMKILILKTWCDSATQKGPGAFSRG